MKDTKGEIVAKLAAVDGFPIGVTCKCEFVKQTLVI